MDNTPRPPTPEDIRRAWDIIKLSQSMKEPPPQVIRESENPEARASGLAMRQPPPPMPPSPAMHHDWWLKNEEMFGDDSAAGAHLKASSSLLDGNAPEDIEAAIALMEPDLQSLLEEYHVEREIMATLAIFRFTDVFVFSKAGRDEAAFEKFISKNLRLDVEKSMLHNAAAARLTLAWEAAVERKDAQKREDAEARVGGLNKVLTKLKHSTMKRAYEEAHAELEAPDAPSPAYLEYRLEQIEDGELEAEPLDWVTSKEEAPRSRSKKGELPKGKLPTTPEELRTKFKLIARAWEFMRLRNPAKPFMLHLSENTWTDYVDWLLGRSIHGTQIKDPGSNTVVRPSWEVVLNYDLEIRSRAYKLVNRHGYTIRDALTSARNCKETFGRHFQGPMTVQAGIVAARQAAAAEIQRQGSKRPWSETQSWNQQQNFPPPPQPLQAPGKDKGKDKGKGKGKGKDKGKDKGKAERQFTGWRIGGSNFSEHESKWKCFGYQKLRCTVANCPYAHRCLVCDDTHAEKHCPKRPRSEGDAGGRAVR